MESWKMRLMVLLAAVAMMVTVAGPVMADDFDFDDCVFIDGEVFCEVDDFDEDDFFFDEDDFDDFDDFDEDDFFFFDDEFFFFDDDFDGIDDNFDDCIGAEIGGECFGIES